MLDTPRFTSLPRQLLVVEDDPIQLRAYDRFTRHFGIEMRWVSRTTDVLRLALEGQPEGIVLDLELEDGNSLNVLRALRRAPATRDIPVAVISGYLSNEMEDAVHALGVATLPKPWTLEELTRTLSRFCQPF